MEATWTHLPFPEELDLHGCLDGFVLTYAGREIGRFGTLSAAARGLTAAREALAKLQTITKEAA